MEGGFDEDMARVLSTEGGFDEDMARVIEVLSVTIEALLRTKDLMNTDVFDKNISEATTALGLCKNLLEDLGEL